MNAQQIKEQLNINHYEQIFVDLDIPIVSKGSDKYVLMTACHNKNAQDGSPKLEMYLPQMNFKCYTHDCKIGDIIGLIQCRWDILGVQYTFLDVLHYIADLCDLDIKSATFIPKKKEYSVLDMLNKYTNPQPQDIKPTIYDKNILNHFPKLYHESFINDGISIPAMEKYNVRYYPYKQQILLPVYDNIGEFVGIHSRNLNEEIIAKGYKYQPCKLINGTEYKFPTSMILYGLYQNIENIKKTKAVVLSESPKSVMQFEDILLDNISVGLFGMNLSKYKRDLLLELGVNNFIISLDKQYEVWDNNDDKFKKWIKVVNKMVNILKGYGNISVICDKKDLLKYKDSPSDYGKDIWGQLWESRVRI